MVFSNSPVRTTARLFDGQTASAHDVSVVVSRTGLIITHYGRSETWELTRIQPVERRPGPNGLRLKHRDKHGARLIIPRGPAMDALIQDVPRLGGAFNSARFLKLTGAIMAGLLLVILAGYGVLNYAPEHLANRLPDEWRIRLADQTENTLLGKSAQCTNKAGQKALLRLAGRVASGTDLPPDFTIRVFDKNILNAFALPDGRIVLTRKLVETAQTPEEIAGVIAHELGHVWHRHPEAALVRLVGMQLFLSVITGGGDGETLGTIAGLATMLRYTRSAEVQADDYAKEILVSANINTGGIRSFFEKVKKLQGKRPKGTTGKLLDFLSTHPGTDERIKKFDTLPETETKSPLSDIEFAALKAICKADRGENS